MFSTQRLLAAILLILVCTIARSTAVAQENEGSAIPSSGELTTSTGPADQEDAEVHYLSQAALKKVAVSISEVLETQGAGAKSLVICGSDECNRMTQQRLQLQLYRSATDRIINDSEALQSPLQLIIERIEGKEIIAALFMERYSGELRPGAAMAQTEYGEAVAGIGNNILNPTGTLLRTGIGLFNMLRRTDVTSVSSTVSSIDDSHLTTAIVAELRNRPGTRGTDIYLPKFMQADNAFIGESDVFARYQNVAARLNELQLVRSAIEVWKKQTEGGNADPGPDPALDPEPEEDDQPQDEPNDTADITPYGDDPDQDSASGNQLTKAEEAVIARLDKLIADAKLIVSPGTPPVEGTAEPATEVNSPAYTPETMLKALTDLISAERLNEMLEDGGMVLRVKVVKLLGTKITSRNMILGTKHRFSGSAMVQYVLTDSDGKLVYANTEVIHTGFNKMSDLRDDQ